MGRYLRSNHDRGIEKTVMRINNMPLGASLEIPNPIKFGRNVFVKNPSISKEDYNRYPKLKEYLGKRWIGLSGTNAETRFLFFYKGEAYFSISLLVFKTRDFVEYVFVEVAATDDFIPDTGSGWGCHFFSEERGVGFCRDGDCLVMFRPGVTHLFRNVSRITYIDHEFVAFGSTVCDTAGNSRVFIDGFIGRWKGFYCFHNYDKLSFYDNIGGRLITQIECAQIMYKNRDTLVYKKSYPDVGVYLLQDNFSGSYLFNAYFAAPFKDKVLTIRAKSDGSGGYVFELRSGWKGGVEASGSAPTSNLTYLGGDVLFNDQWLFDGEFKPFKLPDLKSMHISEKGLSTKDRGVRFGENVTYKKETIEGVLLDCFFVTEEHGYNQNGEFHKVGGEFKYINKKSLMNPFNAGMTDSLCYYDGAIFTRDTQIGNGFARSSGNVGYPVARTGKLFGNNENVYIKVN